MTQVISRIFSPKLPMAQHVRSVQLDRSNPTSTPFLVDRSEVLVRFLGSWLDLLVLLRGLHLPSRQSRHSLHAPCPLELWHQRLTESMDHQRQPPSSKARNQHATICDNDYVLYVHVCTWTWTHHDASKDFPLIQYATILL